MGDSKIVDRRKLSTPQWISSKHQFCGPHHSKLAHLCEFSLQVSDGPLWLRQQMKQTHSVVAMEHVALQLGQWAYWYVIIYINPSYHWGIHLPFQLFLALCLRWETPYPSFESQGLFCSIWIPNLNQVQVTPRAQYTDIIMRGRNFKLSAKGVNLKWQWVMMTTQALDWFDWDNFPSLL